MIPHLFFSQLVVLGLLWLLVMRSMAWPSPGVVSQQRPATPMTPSGQPSKGRRQPIVLMCVAHEHVHVQDQIM